MSNDQKFEHLSSLGSFTLLSIAALTIMVGCAIVPGLPNIASQLQITTNSGWLVTLPSLGVVLFAPFSVWLMNKMGLKTALMIGLFLYGLFGVSGAFLSGNISVFIDRILLGGATAVVMATGTSLISEFFQGDTRMLMIAKQGMAIELGGVIFLFIAGVLASMSWIYPFFIYFIAWVFLILVKISIPDLGNKNIRKNQNSKKEGLSKTVVLAYISAIISMIIFFTGIIVLPKKLAGLNFNEAQNGYYLSFVSLIAVLGAALLPRIARKLNDKTILALAMLSYTVAHLNFYWADSTVFMISGGIMLGIGFGLSIPLVNHMTIEYSSEKIRSRNLAYLSMAIFFGQFISSFMEYIASQISIIFLAASLIAFVAGLSLFILQITKNNNILIKKS